MMPLLVALCLIAGPSTAADDTWTGDISDSACGAHHEEAAEGAGKISDRECTLACIRGGSQYVFIAGGQVLAIANQDFAGLPEHAGRTVRLSGTLQNGALTVTKIDNPER